MATDRSEVKSSLPVKEGVEIRCSEPDRPSAEKLQTQLMHNDSAAVKPVYDQDVQSILMINVTGKKQFMSQQKILSDPSDKPDDRSGRPMLKTDVAVKKQSISQKRNVDSEDQDTQSMLKMDVAAKKESVSQKNVVASSNEPEDQGVLEKTPSSVRKMISAFETGLTQKKGRRSLTRTRASKSQPNLVGIGGSLKDLDSDNISSPNKISALRLERPLNTVDLPEPQINIGKRVQNSSPAQDFVGTEQTVFHEQFKQSNVHIVRFNEAGSSQQETFVSAKKESNTVAASPVDLIRLSNLETAISSQTTSVAHPDMLKASNLAADRDFFNGPAVAEKRNREIRSETSPEVHFEKASNMKPKLIACRKDELFDSENSGAWIFPDNKRRLCMTSAGKNIVHLSEDFHIGVDDHQRNKRPSMQETTGKLSFFRRSESTTKKGREKPQKPRTQSESFEENGSSGPVRQVMNIALVVGFGILVLLTRQRETRKNDRKSKVVYFNSPDFMDQLASSEEQWSVLKR
ncbi:hypothetical protein EJD97_010530 [Solanum chilense]|uniref:Uncharacterized protein n=1 Tax=Solanum chilense TaxID=4083 RepID=A0A6N2CHH2_SOLCI|nr:hypothetical protein EJD97_010530 [Solanum chilense]